MTVIKESINNPTDWWAVAARMISVRDPAKSNKRINPSRLYCVRNLCATILRPYRNARIVDTERIRELMKYI